MRRATIEAAIEVLIEILDDLDGDPDLEESPDDEPYLGWAVQGAVGGTLDIELADAA